MKKLFTDNDMQTKEPYQVNAAWINDLHRKHYYGESNADLEIDRAMKLLLSSEQVKWLVQNTTDRIQQTQILRELFWSGVTHQHQLTRNRKRARARCEAAKTPAAPTRRDYPVA